MFLYSLLSLFFVISVPLGTAGTRALRVPVPQVAARFDDGKRL